MCSTGRADQPYVISTSPDLSNDSAERVFVPLAKTLTDVTGKLFTYEPPGTWLNYIRNIRQSKYDLVFDEAHLVSWRAKHLEHIPVLRLSGDVSYVVFTRDADQTVVQLRDLAGYPVCTRSPFALEGIILLAQFTDPNRQPRPYPVLDTEDAYKQLQAGNCRGAIVPAAAYEALTTGGNETRILYLSETFPNRAMTIGPSIIDSMQDEITSFLLDHNNAQRLSMFADPLESRPHLHRASMDDYAGFDALLDGFWGLR